MSRYGRTLSALKHRITLCTMKDVIEKDGMMHLTRAGVTTLWAEIKAISERPSFLSTVGYQIIDPKNVASHNIAIRRAACIEATSAAWAYEMRLKSQPRWFKILGWLEDGNWLILSARLHERSDDASRPVDILDAAPQDVVI